MSAHRIGKMPFESTSSNCHEICFAAARTMFGRTATEVMWITDAVENEYYQTRAENHDAVYISRLQIEPKGDENCLTMSFEGYPQGAFTKILATVTGFMFKGATEKALKTDLDDIKAFVENNK